MAGDGSPAPVGHLAITVARLDNDIGGARETLLRDELRHAGGVAVNGSIAQAIFARAGNLRESRDESWLWIWREKKKFVW